jgi:hypothetical protein
MTAAMHKLIEQVEKLPPHQQEEAARVASQAIEEMTTQRARNVTAQLEKLKALSEWIDKNRTGGENVDDSRDSIYDGTFDSPR